MSELRTNRIVPRDGVPSGSFGGGIIGQGDSLVVESDYKSSVIIGNSGTAQYSFTPTSNIAVGSSLLRATGDVALTIS